MRREFFKGLVVGLGPMGLNHLRVLEAMPEVRIVAVVDSDAERLRAACAGRGVPPYSGLDEALDVTRPDFVCLATPIDQLPSLAQRSLSAGVAVLVEKPMAPDEESGLALIRLARSRRLLLSVGHVERFNPAVQAVKREIEAGRIGHVHKMHSRRLSPPDPRLASMGLALDLATHDVDVMRYLVGSEVRRVRATTVRQEGSLVEDDLQAVVTFDDGTTGLIEASCLATEKVRELVVVGERGTLAVDYLAQEVTEHREGAGPQPLPVTRCEPLRAQWEAFVHALRSGSAPEVSGFDGVAALSCGLALRLSGARRETVVPAYRAYEATLPVAL
jgi:predicted dehydrogenase